MNSSSSVESLDQAVNFSDIAAGGAGTIAGVVAICFQNVYIFNGIADTGSAEELRGLDTNINRLELERTTEDRGEHRNQPAISVINKDIVADRAQLRAVIAHDPVTTGEQQLISIGLGFVEVTILSVASYKMFRWRRLAGIKKSLSQPKAEA